jgi:ubiquinol oxidase
MAERLALAVTRLLRFFADTFFATRYGHRAIVVETVAAMPGMVSATVLERFIILIAQWIFRLGFFLLHLDSRRTAHRLVGYSEEEAAPVGPEDRRRTCF